MVTQYRFQWRMAELCRVSFVLLSGGAVAHGGYIDAMGCCRHGSQVQLLAFPMEGCDAGTAPTDFDGEICQVITNQGIDQDGHPFAELEVTSFEMLGMHPVFGKLTITLDESRPGAASTLRSVNPGADFPVTHVTRIHVNAVAENLPGIVLQNQGPPLEFTSQPLASWPPTMNTYDLPVAVPFEDRDNPGMALITACPGSVTVKGRVVSTNPALPGWAGVLLAGVLFVAGVFVFGNRRREPAT